MTTSHKGQRQPNRNEPCDRPQSKDSTGHISDGWHQRRKATRTGQQPQANRDIAQAAAHYVCNTDKQDPDPTGDFIAPAKAQFNNLKQRPIVCRFCTIERGEGGH